jgi:beta-1,4-mannosyl-glycoprotein beta-1,4-N-acetylglucosaminyltransferase
VSHTGREKRLWFADNRQHFSKYLHRIVHVVFQGSRLGEVTAWEREAAQRNAILEGLAHTEAQPADYVIISDCDEVPRPDLLARIKRHGLNIFVEPDSARHLYDLEPVSVDTYRFEDEVFGLLQDYYYYDLECKHDGIWWQSRVLTYRKLLALGSPEQVRRMDLGTQYFSHAGWHFSYFGGVERIATKIRSYSHQEYNTPEFVHADNIKDAVRTRRDLFGRESIGMRHIPLETNDNLPANYKMLM